MLLVIDACSFHSSVLHDFLIRRVRTSSNSKVDHLFSGFIQLVWMSSYDLFWITNRSNRELNSGHHVIHHAMTSPRRYACNHCTPLVILAHQMTESFATFTSITSILERDEQDDLSRWVAVLDSFLRLEQKRFFQQHAAFPVIASFGSDGTPVKLKKKQ